MILIHQLNERYIMGRKVSLLSIVFLVLFITSCNHGESLRNIISKISSDGLLRIILVAFPSIEMVIRFWSKILNLMKLRKKMLMSI